jgi:hypothetical protein
MGTLEDHPLPGRSADHLIRQNKAATAMDEMPAGTVNHRQPIIDFRLIEIVGQVLVPLP